MNAFDEWINRVAASTVVELLEPEVRYLFPQHAPKPEEAQEVQDGTGEGRGGLGSAPR